MKFSLFYHSMVSDWNHGNAHFLRGVVSDLLERGHQVQVFEPADGWSRQNLLLNHGPQAIEQFHAAYPQLDSILYDRDSINLEDIIDNSDVVVVHEWNEAWLVNGFGEARQRGPASRCRLLFHDTHHRAVSDPEWIRRFALEHYDGVLAFGEVLSEVYRAQGWSERVWTWHEAADHRIFHPRQPVTAETNPTGDLVWIGNWGDGERAAELEEFLFQPVRELSLSCRLYGVRYPADVLRKLEADGVNYCGWLPNFRVPEVFAGHRVTVHVPRRHYVQTLPGIPTIRPFEVMACGIPLISAPWQDGEGLFTPGKDFLVARDGQEMKKQLRRVLQDRELANELSEHALATILARHTCTHRVDQLMEILGSLGTLTTENRSCLSSA